ncbi:MULTISPECIES: hypothetical protein [Bradyrhizobium]|uniref:Uncharacterized protein n=3 Tax=Bradyrhizobium TaxID=374 RepID=A0ACD3VLS6_9BRAD|nr:MULTISPECIES: hypothetical protein [Bradyrhizobium]UFX49366.1 hypothetical protein HAP47_0041330 [Bradyrhizobium sp. 41S5]UGA49091.1 hypothetical protein HU230_0043060 [Bradyrhizobium quebecense]UGY07496.1 hypothetical protein J4P68_0040800 [Bradyrhizobium quebecense]
MIVMKAPANGRVEKADILSGHFAATRTRYDDCAGPILLIQEHTAQRKNKINPTRVLIEKKESIR